MKSRKAPDLETLQKQFKEIGFENDQVIEEFSKKFNFDFDYSKESEIQTCTSHNTKEN